MLALAFYARENGDEATAWELATRGAELGSLMAKAVVACWRWDATGDVSLEHELQAGVDSYQSCRADLADLLVRTGRPDEAIALLRVGVARLENQAYLPLGNMLWERGEVDEAENLFLQGIGLGDDHCADNLRLLRQERGCRR